MCVHSEAVLVPRLNHSNCRVCFLNLGVTPSLSESSLCLVPLRGAVPRCCSTWKNPHASASGSSPQTTALSPAKAKERTCPPGRLFSPKVAQSPPPPWEAFGHYGGWSRTHPISIGEQGLPPGMPSWPLLFSHVPLWERHHEVTGTGTQHSGP